MKPSITTIVAVLVSGLLTIQASYANEQRLDSPAVLNVQDLTGRELRFEKTPERIIIGEGRYLAVLSVLYPDNPFKKLVGMLSELKAVDFGTYQQYQRHFPQIDTITKVGHSSPDSFSVEQALTLNADLAIFGVSGHGPNPRQERLVEQLEKAGTQVVFVDFRNAPLVNTPKSLQLLGKILDREDQIDAFLKIYHGELKRVTDVLAAMPADTPKTKVFLHSRVGLMDACCETMVRGMMAAFVEAGGGENVALDYVPGFAGVFNLEHLLSNQPDVYIGTAVGSTEVLNIPIDEAPPYIALGTGVSEDRARISFQAAIHHSGLRELSAVKQNRAYTIWHHFYNSPLNVVAVQVVAKWLYPEQFADLDPRDTLQRLFDDYQSIPLDGAYWLALSP